MKITWVNHAGHLIEAGGIGLLSDPWLEGRAFNNSWELMVPSTFRAEDWSRVTHLWFSHEHPDHFCPPVLMKVPRETREKIVVLYQETRDGRVLDFCRKQGFQVQSLTDGAPVRLGNDFTVTCGKVPFYDSHLLIEADGQRVFNLNDCVLEGPALERLRKRLGSIDVLLSQFSYASWHGNADDAANWRAGAAGLRDQLLHEVRALAPKYTIPCASFVRFCHDATRHMNQHANAIADIAKAIETEAASRPVVLFPGDQWDVGAAHDSAPALQRYTAAAASEPPYRPKSVATDELLQLAAKYREKMLKQNSGALIAIASALKVFPLLTFRVSDIGETLTYTWGRGLYRDPGAAPDVTLHSDSLAFLFRFDWGMDTLQVSGAFSASKNGFRKLLRTFSVGSLNNIGLTFGPGIAVDGYFIRRALSKIIRAA